MKTSTHTLAGIEFSERYNVYRTIIDHWIVLEIDWHEGGYRASVCGARLKKQYATPEFAAVALVRFVRNSLEKLPTEEK